MSAQINNIDSFATEPVDLAVASPSACTLAAAQDDELRLGHHLVMDLFGKEYIPDCYQHCYQS
jgi:hypothetical protein